MPGPGLEGSLFPDTYRFTPGTALTVVLKTMTDRYRRQQQAGGEPYLQRLQRMREYNRRYYLGTLKQRRRRHAAASQPAASQPATSQPASHQPASNKFMLQL